MVFVLSCSMSPLVGCDASVEEKLVEIRVLQAKGQIQPTITILAEMIESGERGGETLFRYGRALALAGLPGRAVWALDAAMDDPDWIVRAGHQLASDANRSGNFDFALEIFERLRDERPDSHAEDLPARLLEARVLLNTRRFYDEALEQIELILDDWPENEEAIRLKAVALLGMKQTDEAYELIREAGILAVEIVEQDGSDEGERAVGEEEVVVEESEQDLELASDPDSDRLETYWCSVRASFKREAGEIEEAHQIVEECLKKFPSSPELINEAIRVLTRLGRFGRILEILRASHEAAPKNPDLRSALVEHLTSVGLTEEAEAILVDAIDKAKNDEAVHPVQIAKLWLNLANFLLERDLADRGLEAFDEAIAILGDRAAPDLLFRYGDALILAERYDEAIEIADKTLIEVHGPMLRGRVAFERGDYETALAELSAAALIWPDNAPTRYYLARAAEGTGDFDLAIQEYRQAMRSDPTLSAARERLIRLHLAEGRVRRAASIHRFTSPKGGKFSPSVDMKILAIEMQARLGNEPDLSIPTNFDISLAELQKWAIAALGRGVRLRSGVREAQSLLAMLEDQVEPSSKEIFVREQVELLLRDDEDVKQALEIARRADAEWAGRPAVTLALGRALVRAGADLDEAKLALQAALERDAEETDALASLADLAALRGDDESALANYDKAIALAPNHWQAVSGRIAVLLRTDRKQEAIDTNEAFVNRGSPYDARGALGLARLLANDESARDRRIALARRAIRFGAGREALDLLTSLDPEAAAEYQESSPSETPTTPTTPTEPNVTS